MYEYQEFPKWIEFNGDKTKLKPETIQEDIKDDKGKLTGKIRIVVDSDEDLFYLEDDERKKEIKDDLKKNYDMDIDLRKFTGPSGMGSLEAYYKAMQVGSKKK